ncbi:hypothetical protein HPB51_005821 [Rhipicephalus microplus]|uniref:Transposase n=1 Tax=Rhipicephalus microplus TaxID=6941 RepID=A0A9J6D8P8_RHIMP|nr:hypothetical protein HPB51_005821 [Rhipicephalus microplus]
MRVKQVFSESVSVALLTLMATEELPIDAKATAEFIERMDKLSDSLNNSAMKKQDDKLRYAMSHGSEHHTFLEQCITWIAGWHFGGPQDKQPHIIKGWQITIKALLLLWQDLQTEFGFSNLLTRHLQEDPLENFFATIRQKHGCNEAPNVYEFTAALKHICIGKLFRLSAQGNCEVTTNAFLTNIEDASGFVSLSSTPAVSQSTLHYFDCDDPQTPLQEHSDITYENVIYHVTGTLVKGFLGLRATDCTCNSTLLDKDGGVFSGKDRLLHCSGKMVF